MVQSSSFVQEVETSCVNAVCDCRESDPKSCDARLSLPAVGVDGEVSLHPTAFHSLLSHVSTRPKVRRNNWKYQSGLLPKFQRAVAQGASEQTCLHLCANKYTPMAP